jgi:hypothetical protein
LAPRLQRIKARWDPQEVFRHGYRFGWDDLERLDLQVDSGLS